MQFLYVCRCFDKEVQPYIGWIQWAQQSNFFLDLHDERDILSNNDHHITLGNDSWKMGLRVNFSHAYKGDISLSYMSFGAQAPWFCVKKWHSAIALTIVKIWSIVTLIWNLIFFNLRDYFKVSTTIIYNALTFRRKLNVIYKTKTNSKMSKYWDQ